MTRAGATGKNKAFMKNNYKEQVCAPDRSEGQIKGMPERANSPR